MAFALSVLQTINGIAGYEVTGSGNLDDLAAACSSIGFSRSNNVYTYNPGTTRLLAISGTLTEARNGIYSVRILNSGHVCWGYAASSVITLGAKNATTGVYTSQVDIVYESTALAMGGDLNLTTPGKCFIGNGSFYGVCGSVSYNHNARHDFDVSDGATFFSLDKWTSYLTTAGASYSHLYKPNNKISTTANTVFTFVQRPMEGNRAVTTVTPFNHDIGFRWLAGVDTDVVRIFGATYSGVDAVNNTAGSTMEIVDPSSRYIGVCNPTGEPQYKTFPGIKKIKRTLYATASDELGAAIANATPKLITITSTGSSSVTSFSGKIASSEVLQSTRASGVTHDNVGSGWTNEGNYSFYIVGFGYAANYKNVNVGTANSGTAGVLWGTSIAKSNLVTSTYASVVTTPFTYATSGNGALTIGSAATSNQVAEYLFKQAYDNPDAAYWMALNHKPATGTTDAISIGSINLNLNNVLSGASLSTAGNITIGATGMPTAPVGGAVITVSGTNTATLNASTRIEGLATTGTISTGGKLGFGSGTTINAAGDLVISGTELAGSLTINTSVARTLTLSNCTGMLSAITVTGGGSVQVLFTNGTKATILPASLPTSVTSAVVVTIQAESAFNLLTITDFGNTGETETFTQNATTHTRNVPPGRSLRIAYGALAKVPAYQFETSVAESKTISLNILDDTNVSASTYIEDAKAMLAWDNLNTAANKLKMRVGAGSIQSVTGQNALSYMSWQHQCLRLIARTANSKQLTTTSQGIALGTTAITIEGKSANLDIDPCKILTYITAPAGHIITPKSEGGTGEPPRGFSVQVTEVPPVQAWVEDEQLARIATLAKSEIEGSTVIAKTAAILSLQTDVTAVKAKTDNLPALPAAVGSAMTLTSAYDSAKSAASQISVDGIKTATDKLRFDANNNIKSLEQDKTGFAPTLIEIEASTVLANATSVAAIKADTDAIKVKSDTITVPPSAAEIKTALEASGSKLDKALKAAQAAEDQTL